MAEGGELHNGLSGLSGRPIVSIVSLGTVFRISIWIRLCMFLALSDIAICLVARVCYASSHIPQATVCLSSITSSRLFLLGRVAWSHSSKTQKPTRFGFLIDRILFCLLGHILSSGSCPSKCIIFRAALVFPVVSSSELFQSIFLCPILPVAFYSGGTYLS